MLLDEEKVIEYLDKDKFLCIVPMGFDAKELVDRYFIVTGMDKYFKTLKEIPKPISLLSVSV